MIELWELGGDDDRRYSNFSRLTRWALRHKGLEATVHPVHLTDKAAIAFSGGRTVPVIRDGDTVVRDSWQIAEYLERTYPDRPSLFGGAAGHGLCLFVNTWVDRTVVAAAFPALACDAIAIQDVADRDYFRASIEKITGATPEALKERQAGNVEKLLRAVDPARATLKRQAFLGGAAACYADYALASVFQWARIVSPVRILPADDPLAPWFERILSLHDGHARATTAFH